MLASALREGAKRVRGRRLRAARRRDYGRQVTGFVVNPAVAGMKYVDGMLVPLSTPEPDWDAYVV